MGQLMMSVSGVRGVVGAALTPDRVTRFAAAFGTLSGGGKVVVGRDSRTTGEMVYSAVLSGLLGTGCDVVNLGIVPTPTVQLLVESLGAQGGIAVTASHNPPQWNALKFISHRGTFLEKAEATELFAIESENRIAWADHALVGSASEYHGGVDDHIERILGLPFLEPVTRPIRVVVDALHGAGGPIAARLLQALGCDAEVLYLEPTGRFPRGAEPVPENIGELGRVVIERKADVGFALDPDGDRLALVDERGVPMGEEATLPMAVSHVLSQRPGPVVANYSTSLLVDTVAGRCGCPVYRAPVGEANVVARMREVDAAIGGEGNGGVILPDVHLGRDAPVAMALIVSLLARDGRPISVIRDDLPRYMMQKEKFEIAGNATLDGLDQIAAGFDDAQIDRTDGLYLRWPDGFLHVRKSGTEPIVRVIAEARDTGTLNLRMSKARELMRMGR